MGKVIIEGITESGQKFRPSDWAERMSGGLCTLRHRRVIYSPLLQPATRDGVKCLILDDALKDSNAPLYHDIIHFAEKNNLRQHHENA